MCELTCLPRFVCDAQIGYTTPESVPDVFKTPPVYDRSVAVANGQPASASGSTVGARTQGGGTTLQELLQGGKMMGGISLQDMLMGTGITLSPSGVLSGAGESDEEEDDDDEEEGVSIFTKASLRPRLALLTFPALFSLCRRRPLVSRSSCTRPRRSRRTTSK